jgi:hypothetical protein
MLLIDKIRQRWRLLGWGVDADGKVITYISHSEGTITVRERAADAQIQLREHTVRRRQAHLPSDQSAS